MAARLEEYRTLGNLDFRGHTTGEEKRDLLRRAKLLVNTSIHEAVPVSFLEALSYGCLLVSCQFSDGITERFGRYTGKVLGQGQGSLDAFEGAIRDLLRDEPRRHRMAQRAVAYVRSEHSIDRFQRTLRDIIHQAFAA